jgi:hypothetical protein
MPSTLLRARRIGVALAFSDFELRLDSSRLLLVLFFASRLVPIRFQLFQADVDDAGKQFLGPSKPRIGFGEMILLILRSEFPSSRVAFKDLIEWVQGFPY